MDAPERTDPDREILEEADSTLLDLVDNLLTKGVMVTGDLILAIANVDMIYLRLGVLLCAADRVLPPEIIRKRAREAP